MRKKNLVITRKKKISIMIKKKLMRKIYYEENNPVIMRGKMLLPGKPHSYMEIKILYYEIKVIIMRKTSL